MRAARLTAVVAVACSAMLGPGTPASAVTPSITPNASAFSAGAGTGSATLAANLQLAGSLGRIIDALIGPIVSQDLNPIVSALTSSTNSVVASTLGTSSSEVASTSPGQLQYTTAPAAFPNDSLPSPCVSSGAQPCYSLAGSTPINASPLASVVIGAVNGYVEQVASSADATNPILGRATVARASVSALPAISSLVPGLPSVVNPLVSTSVVAAMANCPNDGAAGSTKPATAPTARSTASTISLLQGLVTFSALDGQITNLIVNGVSYSSVTALPSVSVAGVTIAPYGASVLVSIPLSVSQLITGLGLGSLLSTLNGFAPVSTVALRIVVGPNATVTPRSASAFGLGIGVDLSGSLTFNLLDLVTASIAIPTGISGSNYGNVFDLRLATATCQSGVVVPATTPAIPNAYV